MNKCVRTTYSAAWAIKNVFCSNYLTIQASRNKTMRLNVSLCRLLIGLTWIIQRFWGLSKSQNTMPKSKLRIAKANVRKGKREINMCRVRQFKTTLRLWQESATNLKVSYPSSSAKSAWLRKKLSRRMLMKTRKTILSWSATKRGNSREQSMVGSDF